jgi:hypothetical protein
VIRQVPAYRGEEPYVFVCYAHEDQALIYPELSWLREQGVHIWYDEGIAAGQVWRAELARAIDGAKGVIFYISSASLSSMHCKREVNYALDRDKPVLPIYLKRADLPNDLELALGSIQALHRSAVPADSYRSQLVSWSLSQSLTASSSEPGMRLKGRRIIAASTLLIAVAVASLWVFQRSTPARPESPQAPRRQAVVEYLEPSALRGSDLLGRWCAVKEKDLELEFLPDQMNFYVGSQKQKVSYVPRAYVITSDSIKVLWRERPDDEKSFTFEFGDFDASRTEMVQKKGLEGYKGSWLTYDRSFRRCEASAVQAPD